MLTERIPNVWEVHRCVTAVVGTCPSNLPALPTQPRPQLNPAMVTTMPKPNLTASLPFPRASAALPTVTLNAGVQPRCRRRRAVGRREALRLDQLDLRSLIRAQSGGRGSRDQHLPLRIHTSPLWGDGLWGEDSWFGREVVAPVRALAQGATSVFRGGPPILGGGSQLSGGGAQRPSRRGSDLSSGILPPGPQAGDDATATPAGARAVCQREMYTFYLDLVGAATIMTLVVLAAILV